MPPVFECRICQSSLWAPDLECQACYECLVEAPDICPGCLSPDCLSPSCAIAPKEGGFEFVKALYWYTGQTAAILRNWKKHLRWPRPAPWTPKLRGLSPPTGFSHVVAATPNHRRHLELKGAWVERFARDVARHWNLKYVSLISKNPEWFTPPRQALLRGAARFDREISNWGWPPENHDHPTGIIFVDDFLTTGRTLLHLKCNVLESLGPTGTERIRTAAFCLGVRPQKRFEAVRPNP